MTNNIISSPIPAVTIGLDLSDKTFAFCRLDAAGDVVERGHLPLTRNELRKRFAGLPTARVALECGTQSAWVQDVLLELGHEVIVANAREVRSIAASARKSDTRDAEQLARLARLDPSLLHPITHRGKERRLDMVVIRTRALLVESRTRLVVGARNLAKMFGERIPSCTTKNFAARAASSLPPALNAALSVIVKQIEAISEAIEQCDQQVEQLCAKLPETQWPASGCPSRPALSALSLSALGLTFAESEPCSLVASFEQEARSLNNKVPYGVPQPGNHWYNSNSFTYTLSVDFGLAVPTPAQAPGWGNYIPQ
jgi:hypothetical protein